MGFPYWPRGPVRLHLLANNGASRLALPITQRSATRQRAGMIAQQGGDPAEWTVRQERYPSSWPKGLVGGIFEMVRVSEWALRQRSATLVKRAL
jgi:hypothetical protein